MQAPWIRHVDLELPAPFDLVDEDDLRTALNSPGAPSYELLTSAIEALDLVYQVCCAVHRSDFDVDQDDALLKAAKLRNGTAGLWAEISRELRKRRVRTGELTPELMWSLLVERVEEEEAARLLQPLFNRLARTMASRSELIVDFLSKGGRVAEPRAAAAIVDLAEKWWTELPQAKALALLELVASVGEPGLPLLRRIGCSTTDDRADIETTGPSGTSLRHRAGWLRSRWFNERSLVDTEPVPGFETATYNKRAQRAAFWQRVRSWLDDRNDHVRTVQVDGDEEVDVMAMAPYVAISGVFSSMLGTWLLPGDALEQPWGVIAGLFAVSVLAAGYWVHASSTDGDDETKRVLLGGFMFALGLGPIAYFTPHLLNRHLGDQESRVVRSVVVERIRTRFPRSRVEAEGERFVIPGGRYEGAEVLLTIHEGFFGWRWLEASD